MVSRNPLINHDDTSTDPEGRVAKHKALKILLSYERESHLGDNSQIAFGSYDQLIVDDAGPWKIDNNTNGIKGMRRTRQNINTRGAAVVAGADEGHL